MIAQSKGKVIVSSREIMPKSQGILSDLHQPTNGQFRIAIRVHYFLSGSTLIIDEQIRKLLFQRFNLGTITNLNVRIFRVVQRVVLVVVLSTVEALQGRNLSNDATLKHFRTIQLRDISIRNPLLIITDIKDRRAIRRAYIWPLPVELRGIVGHGKEDAQEFAVGNLGGIVNHFNGLGMPGRFRRYLVVGCSCGGAASISGCSMDDAFLSFKDCLCTPKTAASKHCSLLAWRRSQRLVYFRRRN